MAASPILDSLLRGDRAALLDELEVSSVDAWRQACIDLITTAPVNVAPDAAHSLFTELGHRVRDEVDDDRLMVSALRQLLPKFATMTDPKGMVLYRGENFDRYQLGRVGLCWTPKREVAEMFRGAGRRFTQRSCSRARSDRWAERT